MNRPVINIDLDGVVYDYVGAMKRYAEGVLGRALPEWTEWDVWDQWGITPGAWDFIFRRGVEDGAVWREGDVLPGAIEGLWVLSDNEWHIRIVTNRLSHRFGHDLAVSHTVAWLREHAIPYRSLAVLGYGDAKSNYRAQTLVDDSLVNIRDWDLYQPLGRPSGILFDQPWNRDYATGLVVARSWPEVVELVLETRSTT